jgi:hypothetical protein
MVDIIIMIVLVAGFVLLAAIIVIEVMEERRNRMLLHPEEYDALCEVMLDSARRSAEESSRREFARAEFSYRVRRRVLAFVSANHAGISGKHDCNVGALVMGKPENAARGLFYFMGVSDPFATEGVGRILAEISSFMT